MTKKHTSDFDHCDYCQRYVALGERLGDAKGYAATTRKLHNVAIRRAEREQALRDAGLVKVRGALGGVYWE